MIFDSDLNGSFSYAVTLTSPPINCSGQAKVFLACQNQYIYYSEQGSVAEVGVSTNGVDFVYRQVLANTLRFAFETAVQNLFVELPEAAGQPTVYVRFRWTGEFEYFWKLDDLALYTADPRPANDLFLAEGAIPSAYATPVSQVDSLSFAVIAGNAGRETQSGILATVRIFRNDTLLFEAAGQVSDLLPGEQDTVVFASKFLPDRRAVYHASYQVEQLQAELWPVDNELAFRFVVTENLFSVDNGMLVDAIRPPELTDPFWEVGNYYRVPESGFQAVEAVFSIASVDESHIGQSIALHLYRVTPDNNPNEFSDSDLFPVGYGAYTFLPGDENYGLFTAPILNLDNNETGVDLMAGADYILSMTLGEDLYCPYSVRRQYYDIATVVRNGQWFPGGFGPDVAAMVRMGISPVSVPVIPPSPENGGPVVFPQPTSGICYLEWKKPPLKHLDAFVLSANGTMVTNLHLTGAEMELLDLSPYPPGVYWLHLNDGARRWVKRVLVQRRP